MIRHDGLHRHNGGLLFSARQIPNRCWAVVLSGWQCLCPKLAAITAPAEPHVSLPHVNLLNRKCHIRTNGTNRPSVLQLQQRIHVPAAAGARTGQQGMGVCPLPAGAASVLFRSRGLLPLRASVQQEAELPPPPSPDLDTLPLPQGAWQSYVPVVGETLLFMDDPNKFMRDRCVRHAVYVVKSGDDSDCGMTGGAGDYLMHIEKWNWGISSRLGGEQCFLL
jgi:hypothetical protein